MLIKKNVRIKSTFDSVKVWPSLNYLYGSQLTPTITAGSGAEFPGDIIYADSPSYADVSAAIYEASPGDTVIVPNGSATWSNQLSLTKGVILKAQTKGGVTITSNYAGYLIRFDISSTNVNDPIRISGFNFDFNNIGGGFLIYPPSWPAITKFRLDNNLFKNTPASYGVMRMWGSMWGCIDNNTFENINGVCFLLYGGGQYIWQYVTFNFGTQYNLYIEDNDFTLKSGLINAGDSVRYCVRYNDITLQSGVYPVIDLHGNMGPGGNYSGIGAEVYENNFYTGSYGADLVEVRGGKALIYNNTSTNTGSWTGYDVREEQYDTDNPPAINLISGQPQHVSDTYCWGNKKNGVDVINDHGDNIYAPATLYYSDLGRYVPLEDYDYWKWVSPFDGSTGIGVGSLSERPSSCSKEGVAWWATDQNKLYRWHNGAWELFYTPYTYPHPYRSDQTLGYEF